MHLGRLALCFLPWLVAVAPAGAQLADGPCPMHAAMDADARARVRCVTLDVPESVDRPQGRRLTLRAAVVSPRGPERGVPVLFLHGGPGGMAVRAAAWFLQEPLGPRTYVLLDQRASGSSVPELCPDLRSADLALTVRGLDAAAGAAAQLPLFRACRDALRGAGADLNAYSAAAVVGDAEQLRIALGIERWDLMGISYGTRIALAYRDLAPQAIRALLLDSVTPPGAPFFLKPAADLWRSLQALDALCRQDVACARRWGPLDAAALAAAEGLKERPMRLPVDDPLAVDGHITLGAPTFLIALQQILYDRELYAIVPLLLDRLRRGDGASLHNLAAQLLAQSRRGDRIDVIAAFECPQASAIEPAATDPAHDLPMVLAELSNWRRWLTEICPMWVEGGRFDAPAKPIAAGRELPAFVLAGAIDPITPPSASRRTAEALGAAHAELAYTGHGALLEPCGKAMATAFLDDPRAAPDAGCVGAEPPIAFVDGAVLAPGAGRLAHLLWREASVPWIGAAAVLALALGSALLWPWARGLPQLPCAAGAGRRRLGQGPTLALAAGCVVAFATGLGAAVAVTASQLPALLLLGLPRPWLPIFALPWIAVACVAASLWLRVARGDGLRPRHLVVLAGVLLSLAAFGALGLLTPTVA